MNDIYTIYKDQFPTLLNEINDPPTKLNVKGQLPKPDSKILCIVGARRHSSYGREACTKLIAGLKGHNICIVSGMALGIDSLVHRTAIDNGIQTIAFPGSGLNEDILYPRTNTKLAEEIVYSGGALISEFDNDQASALWTFPKRNRLMAGISHAVIVIEAELISGTLITSKLATEYNRDVGAVPGQIYSSLSDGPNMLISNGAKIIRSSEDILEILGISIQTHSNKQNSIFDLLNDKEKFIINFLKIEPTSSEQLIQRSNMSARELTSIISNLEIKDIIEEINGEYKLK